MEFDEKLLQLGCKPVPLPQIQRDELDEQGFTLLENIIDPPWLAQLRQAFDTIHAQEGEQAGKEVAQMDGVRRLADLVNKDEVFDQVYLQPTLLTAVYHILQRPFKLHSLNGHDPLPGHGQQELHADWGKSSHPGAPFHVVNSMWMLDDFTPTNGATRIVPGSHRMSGRVNELVEDRLADHPDQVQFLGPAGSVAVFNGGAWHSCSQNSSTGMRRTLHCAFIAREHPQQTNQGQYLQPQTERRLTPLARYVLDV
jgi:ectoine hydroxylase-related dioxygenase (phytanoyl-CoA dioxygenase family)